MLDLNYLPVKVIDKAAVSHEEWLQARKKGIGGSDVAALFGVSPWHSKRELYFDKIGYSTAEEPRNWFRLDAGNAMEPVLRKAFEKKTGFTVSVDTWQYKHPLYPFMLADADFFTFDQDGDLCGGEIKTTDEANLDQWHEGVVGEEGRVPIAYEFQARHYMAVFNINKWYFICAYGFSEAKTMIVVIERDFDIEQIIIEEEKRFWENNVQEYEPPVEYTLTDEAVKKLRRLMSPPAPSRKKKNAIVLNSDLNELASRFIEKYAEMKKIEKEAASIKGELNAMSIPFTDAIGDNEKGVIFIPGDEEGYEVSFARQTRVSVNAEALSNKYPEIFKELSSVSESRPFAIKKKSKTVLDKLLAK